MLAAGFCLISMNLQAQTDTTELTDMVVTGTRTEKSLKEVPVRTQVVSQDDIRILAAQTLADAVEFTSGVRIENNCQNCGFSQLRLLGLEGKYTQILQDGLPRMSSVAQVYGVEQIPARLIEQIEIVKGGGSALYGPGAVAGIVNVITHEPTESGVSLGATVEDIDGSASQSFTAASDYVSEDGRVRTTVFGQVDERDAYDRNDDGFSDVVERSMTSVGAKMRTYVGDNADLIIEYSRIDEYRRGGDQLDLPEFQVELAEGTDTTSDIGSVTWTQAPSESFDYTVAIGAVLLERDSYYGGGMDPNAYGFTDSPLYTADLQFNHYKDNHTITWGAQAVREELEDVNPGYNRVLDETYDSAGVYLQDDWAVSEDVTLVIGGRIDDHSEIDDPIFSPRVAVKWAPQDDFTVRGAIGDGFRAPQVFDEDLHITIAGGEAQIIENSDDLKEESSRSYTLGGEWTPELNEGVFGLLEVTGFYTELKDAFDTEFVGNKGVADIFERINTGDAEVYGVEFNLGYQVVDSLELRLGWVFQSAEFDEPSGDFGSEKFERTPDNYGVITATYTPAERWTIFVGAKYTGEMEVPHYAGFIEEDRLETTESFFTVDSSVSYALPFNEGLLTATLGVKNLTDEFQSDLDEGPDRDAGYIYGPRFPRTVFASIGMDF